MADDVTFGGDRDLPCYILLRDRFNVIPLSTDFCRMFMTTRITMTWKLIVANLKLTVPVYSIATLMMK